MKQVNWSRAKARLRAIIDGAGGAVKVAETLGISRQGIINWQKPDRSMPSAEGLALLRFHLGVDINDLIDRTTRTKTKKGV